MACTGEPIASRSSAMCYQVLAKGTDLWKAQQVLCVPAPPLRSASTSRKRMRYGIVEVIRHN